MELDRPQGAPLLPGDLLVRATAHETCQHPRGPIRQTPGFAKAFQALGRPAMLVTLDDEVVDRQRRDDERSHLELESVTGDGIAQAPRDPCGVASDDGTPRFVGVLDASESAGDEGRGGDRLQRRLQRR